MKSKVLLIIIIITFLKLYDIKSQPIPSIEENIPFLVTFGKDGDVKWGDDDFVQIFFVVIPVKFIQPFYIRIFDPDCGGQFDELKAEFNTKTSFSIYGGKGAYTNPDSKNIDPVGNYKAGNLLTTKSFGIDTKYDNNWYSFGPFNPSEGELVSDFQGYVFKIVIEGISGDDGNLYRMFISTSNKENTPIEGCNAFTYEYTFRLYDDANNISHIYPYIDDKVISVKISNFDWDNDGIIRVISVAKNGIQLEASSEGDWKSQILPVIQEERNTSFDVQFVKTKYIKNNNVVVYVTNQYGELLPFYVSPIGGIPKYKGKIKPIKIKK
ncbi:MAG: hypothetical protein N3A01_02120 [Bacteroidales bacterium]|nr:hypothetical protein [Bacteroidales bacterium]